jgi:hypothetical protein
MSLAHQSTGSCASFWNPGASYMQTARDGWAEHMWCLLSESSDQADGTPAEPPEIPLNQPLLRAISECRGRLGAALISSDPESHARQQRRLLEPFIILSYLVQTCRTDEQARNRLRELGRSSDELGWAALQLRKTLDDWGPPHA